MKKLRLFMTLLPAISVSAFIGSGSAFAEGIEVSDPDSDTMEQIVAKGEPTTSEQKSVTVSFGDLNVENELGALALYERLQNASKAVCDVEDAKKRKCPSDLRDADKCYHQALDTAVESVDSEMLTSIHYGRDHGEMFAAKAE